MKVQVEDRGRQRHTSAAARHSPELMEVPRPTLGLRTELAPRRAMFAPVECRMPVPWGGVASTRKRVPGVVVRSAVIALHLSGRRRQRCFALLVAAGDVWAWVLDCNAALRAWRMPPVVNYQRLCARPSWWPRD